WVARARRAGARDGGRDLPRPRRQLQLPLEPGPPAPGGPGPGTTSYGDRGPEPRPARPTPLVPDAPGRRGGRGGAPRRPGPPRRQDGHGEALHGPQRRPLRPRHPGATAGWVYFGPDFYTQCWV